MSLEIQKLVNPLGVEYSVTILYRFLFPNSDGILRAFCCQPSVCQSIDLFVCLSAYLCLHTFTLILTSDLYQIHCLLLYTIPLCHVLSHGIKADHLVT